MSDKQFDFKTGVIGVGSMGQNHARVFSEISDLVGVADANVAQARRVASRFGCQVYSDHKELLKQVEAVVIAVPTELHRKVAEAAADAGVHMLCEKPLANSIPDGQAIIDAANDADLTLAVGHIERHNPVVGYARDSLQRGEWGQAITLASRRVSSYPARIKDVGVVFDMAIHDLDVMRYLSGSEIVSVYAAGGRISTPVHEDHVSMLLQFASDQEGICEANWLTPMKVRQMTLTCATHYVELDYIDQAVSVSTSHFGDIDEANLFKTALEVEKRHIHLTKREPLKNELVDLLNAIQKKDKPLVTGEDGLAAVKVAHAAIESLKQKKRVEIEA